MRRQNCISSKQLYINKIEEDANYKTIENQSFNGRNTLLRTYKILWSFTVLDKKYDIQIRKKMYEQSKWC